MSGKRLTGFEVYPGETLCDLWQVFLRGERHFTAILNI